MVALLVSPWVLHGSFGHAASVERWLLSLGVWLVVTMACCMGRKQPTEPAAVDTLSGWLIASVYWAAVLNAVAAVLQRTRLAVLIEPVVPVDMVWSVSGLMPQRNELAVLLCMGLVASLHCVEQPAPAVTLRFKFQPSLTALALGAATALSASRVGAILFGLIVALACLQPGGGNRRNRALVCALAAAGFGSAVAFEVMLGSAPQGLLDRESLLSANCHSRIALWGAAWRWSLAAPLTGWGWSGLHWAQFLHTPYAELCLDAGHAHNLPLQLAVAFGWPLVVACSSVGFVVLYRKRRYHWRFSSRQLACFAMLVLVAAHSMVEHPLSSGPFAMFTLFVVLTSPMLALRGSFRAGGLTAALLALGGLFWLMALISHLHANRAITELAEEQPVAIQALAAPSARADFVFVEDYAAVALLRMQRTCMSLEDRLLHLERLIRYQPNPGAVGSYVALLRSIGRRDEASFYEQRFRERYPGAHARWENGVRVKLNRGMTQGCGFDA